MELELGSRYQAYGGAAFKKVFGMTENTGIVMFEDNSARFKAFSVSGTVVTFGVLQNLPGTNTTSACSGCRLNDDYGILIYNKAAGGSYIRVFSLSGTTVTGGAEQGNYGGYYKHNIAAMSASLVVSVSNSTISGGGFSLVALSVNKTLKTTTPGTIVTVTPPVFTGIVSAKISNFDSSYGLVTCDNYRNNLFVFSVSGTAITAGTVISFSTLTGGVYSYPVAVACLDDDTAVVVYYLYDSVNSNFDLRIKLISRSGYTVSELDDEQIKENVSTSISSHLDANSIVVTDEGKILIFYLDRINLENLVETFEVKSNKLVKILNNKLIEATADGTMLSTSFFPATDSFIFEYSSNLNTYLKIGNATYGGFIPKVMLI